MAFESDFIKMCSITENGFAAKSDVTLPIPDVLHDVDRVEYFKGYTQAMLQAIHLDGVQVKSYFAWSSSYYCSGQPVI